MVLWQLILKLRYITVENAFKTFNISNMNGLTAFSALDL